MNIFFWQKKSESNNPAFAPYEEIDAKRTSKLGYFFLILMVIFGVWQGNNFLSALQASIGTPERNSYCLDTLAKFAGNKQDYGYYYSGYNSYYNGDSCVFSERERQLGLDKVYLDNEPLLNSLKVADDDIYRIQNEINSAQYNRNQIATDYQLSLLESIAATQGAVFNQDSLQTGIVTQDEYLRQLQFALDKTNSNKTALENRLTSAITPFYETIEKARREYKHEVTVNEFLQFLVALLLIVPLFVFVWHRYHQSKDQRSEFAVIWGGLVATAGIMLAQVLLMFIYEILPKQILEQIFALLAQIKILWALLYWLGFILVPLFFGYLIYLIQKKFYNKQAIMMRAVKNAHCPNCSMKTHIGMNNCPVCGYKLKEYCKSCGAMTMSGGSFCEVCGNKHEI